MKELVFLCCLIINLVTLIHDHQYHIQALVLIFFNFYSSNGLVSFFFFIFTRYLTQSFALLVCIDNSGFWVQTKKYIDIVLLLDDMRKNWIYYIIYILNFMMIIVSRTLFFFFNWVLIYFYNIVCEWGLQSHISQF